MDRKTRYTMVDKRGNELFSSNSFLGFVGSAIVVQIGSAIVIAIIGAVICGIASLFG